MRPAGIRQKATGNHRCSRSSETETDPRRNLPVLRARSLPPDSTLIARCCGRKVRVTRADRRLVPSPSRADTCTSRSPWSLISSISLLCSTLHRLDPAQQWLRPPPTSRTYLVAVPHRFVFISFLQRNRCGRWGRRRGSTPAGTQPRRLRYMQVPLPILHPRWVFGLYLTLY